MKQNTKYQILNSARKAFTLLEILVVIGIIAILVGVTSVSYSTANKKARDSRRKEDLKNIASALEQYFSVCGSSYPADLSSGNIICWGPPQITMMSSIPKDPLSATSYTYTHPDGTNNTFQICAPNNPPLETESTNPFCISNQQ